jgi:hypothetical protein
VNTRCFQVSLKDSDAKVDPEEGVIQRVSLISLGEARGHDVFVDKTTLQQVFDQATELGSVKVKADHGSGVFATIGYVDNFSMNDKQVLGDFHIYESEPERNRIFEIASKKPDHLGMSIEFTGDDERVDGQMRARCDELITSALVSDPAANKSLFSKKTVDTQKTPRSVPPKDMATKTPATKLKTKLEDPQKEKEPTEMEAMLSRMEKLETRLSKYESEDEEDEDDEGGEGKKSPKATDPSVEPKVENPDKDKEFDEEADSTALDEDEDEDEDESKKKEKLSKSKLSKKGFSAKASRAEIIALAAKYGMKLSPAGAGDSQAKGKKTFEDLVAEKTTELKGNKNEAIRFCLEHNKAEYAEHRKSFMTPKTPRTL